MIGDVQAVTAHYMEFLFADAPADDPAPCSKRSIAGEAPASSARQPIVRWGSSVGAIETAGVHAADGARRDVYHDGEEIEVRIRFRLPVGSDPAAAGPAFSFKAVQDGSDLIVASSFEEGHLLPSHEGSFEARYRLRAQLAAGDYYLVAALEDRRGGGIAYFDYVEGAHFFTTAWRRRVHGKFVPEIGYEVEPLTAHPWPADP
jgi:lipopolysaccharide transport system ATP-binding protein